MRVLIFGATGFIGSHVVHEAKQSGNFVIPIPSKENNIPINLLSQTDTRNIIEKTNPDVIINCAGVVRLDDDIDVNAKIASSIINSVSEIDKQTRVVLIGSAASYGVVNGPIKPISEDCPLRADKGYGLSKRQEEETAIKLGDELGVSVVVARLFNCIGPGMKDGFLIPSLIKQLKDKKNKNTIKVSRVDSKRDYIDVRDVSRALCSIAFSNKVRGNVYNIGSGSELSTKALYGLVVSIMRIENAPELISTAKEPEPRVASWADIKKIKSDLNWSPKITLNESIRDIVNAQQ